MHKEKSEIIRIDRDEGITKMKNYSIANNYLTLTVTDLGASIIELSTVNDLFPVLRRAELHPDFNAGQSAMYPLLPFANRIKNNQFIWENELITWPNHPLDDTFFLHGNGWIENWNNTRQTPSQLTFELDSSIGNICAYQATMNYQLMDNALLVELSITNKMNSRFPFGLGLHPFFTTLPNSEIQFNAKGLWLENSNHLPTQFVSPVPENFACQPLRKIPEIWINNSYTGWEGEAVLQHDNGMKVILSSDCPILHVFKFAHQGENQAHEPFICLEPQTHAVNDHNNANYGLLQLLKPEQTSKMWMKITVE